MKKLFVAFVMPLVLSLCACATSQNAQTGNANSGIKGQVLVESKGAAEGVFVYAYDSPFNDLRVPTKLISKPTAPDGSYTLDLAPGPYFIVARKRVSGDPKGYLVKGDYEGKYPANPVEVKPGHYETVNISISELEGNFLLAPYIPKGGGMGVSGKVYDDAGKPAAGAFVMLYKERDMIGLPAYLSRAANSEGEYFVYLPTPGKYYVAARLKYGGLPRKGEPYGTYDANKEHLVTVSEREVVSGIDIKLGPFPFDLTQPVPPAQSPAP